MFEDLIYCIAYAGRLAPSRAAYYTVGISDTLQERSQTEKICSNNQANIVH